jgi:hypothetical protein
MKEYIDSLLNPHFAKMTATAISFKSSDLG